MKHTIVATRDFSIDGMSFMPGDEVDLFALKKNNIDFRNLVHARFIALGMAARTFLEVVEANGYKFDKDKYCVYKEIVVEDGGEDEAADEEAVVEEAVSHTEAPMVSEDVNKARSRRRS